MKTLHASKSYRPLPPPQVPDMSATCLVLQTVAGGGAAHTNVPGLECGLKNSAEYEILNLEGSYLGDNAVKAGGKIH